MPQHQDAPAACYRCRNDGAQQFIRFPSARALSTLCRWHGDNASLRAFKHASDVSVTCMMEHAHTRPSMHAMGLDAPHNHGNAPCGRDGMRLDHRVSVAWLTCRRRETTRLVQWVRAQSLQRWDNDVEVHCGNVEECCPLLCRIIACVWATYLGIGPIDD